VGLKQGKKEGNETTEGSSNRTIVGLKHRHEGTQTESETAAIAPLWD